MEFLGRDKDEAIYFDRASKPMKIQISSDMKYSPPSNETQEIDNYTKSVGIDAPKDDGLNNVDGARTFRIFGKPIVESTKGKHLPIEVKEDESTILHSRILTKDLKETEVEGKRFTASEVQEPPFHIALPMTEIDAVDERVTPAKDKNHSIQVQSPRFLLKKSKTYEMEKYSKNFMIIFNHFDIKGYGNRNGTEKDVEALKNTFSKFGFKDDILIHNDLDYRGINKAMELYSTYDFTQHGCVMVVVLTHGSRDGYIRAKDRSYHESELIGHFLDQPNPSLNSKPKLFLIQACRGTVASKAVTVGASADVQHDGGEETSVYTIPTETDVLLLHSSFAGMASHRETQNGSWFVQTFCQHVDRCADTMDLEAIMTEVKKCVAIEKEHYVYNEATSKTDINKQIPVVMSTLIRKLYFKRSLNITIQPENISTIDNPSGSKMDYNYGSFVIPKQHFLHMRVALQIFHKEVPALENITLLNIANSIDADVVPNTTMNVITKEISDFLKKQATNWNLYNIIMFL